MHLRGVALSQGLISAFETQYSAQVVCIEGCPRIKGWSLRGVPVYNHPKVAIADRLAAFEIIIIVLHTHTYHT